MHIAFGKLQTTSMWHPMPEDSFFDPLRTLDLAGESYHPLRISWLSNTMLAYITDITED